MVKPDTVIATAAGVTAVAGVYLSGTGHLMWDHVPKVPKRGGEKVDANAKTETQVVEISWFEVFQRRMGSYSNWYSSFYSDFVPNWLKTLWDPKA